MYRIDESHQLVIHQQLDTSGPTSVTEFKIDERIYIVIANSRNNALQQRQNIVIYQWDEAQELLVPVQRIPAPGIHSVHAFEVSNLGTVIWY